MIGYNKNALKAYQQAQVNTVDQLSLVTMLYEGAIRFLKESIVKIEANSVEDSHKLLIRVQDIVTELICSLDTKSSNPVVINLLSLYEFIYRQLVSANFKKDVTTIKQVIGFFEHLLEGWQDVASQRKKDNVASTANKQTSTSIYT